MTKKIMRRLMADKPLTRRELEDMEKGDLIDIVLWIQARFVEPPPPQVPDKPGWWWLETKNGWEPCWVYQMNGKLECDETDDTMERCKWGGEAVPPTKGSK